jgi:hypothetical protein
MTAAIANGKTIDGDGLVAITALHSTLAANLGAITAAGGVTAAFYGNGTFTGVLGNAVVTVADDVTMTAAIANGKTIDGDGLVAITALHSTLAANLGAITAAGGVTAAFYGNGTFTGVLGNAVVTVADDVTMTAAANVVDNKTINKSGSGSNNGALAVKIVSTADDGAINLTTAGGGSGTATKTFEVTGNVTFTGTLHGSIKTSVASSQTLTTTAAIANGKTIDGSGSVAITALHSQSQPSSSMSDYSQHSS